MTFTNIYGVDFSGAKLAGHSIAVTNKVVFDKAILSSPEARDLKLIAVAAIKPVLAAGRFASPAW